MKLFGAVVLVLALLAFSGCSSTRKTRIDCFHDCKAQRLKWSGVVSRQEREDVDGNRETVEVCRCSIEEPI